MKFIDAIFSGSIFISGSFTPPKGTKDQRPTNPVTASVFFETSDSGSRLLIYNGSGSDGWQEVGLQSDPVPPIPSADVEYLVVAGGGGGGSLGGGGGGGFLSSSLSAIESGSSFTVTVGAGGSGQIAVGGAAPTSGISSSLASLTGTSFTTVSTVGGGHGGGSSNAAAQLPEDGGSGGGGAGLDATTTAGGSGTSGQGNAGGSGIYVSAGTSGAGGGGGGANASGTNASGNTTGGNGGNGKQSSITGTSTYYAGGGGGGAYSYGGSGTGGSAGLGGATAGQSNSGYSTAGTSNTGGGAGSGGFRSDGWQAGSGAGGSGVVILAYDSGSINGAGGLVGDAGNGRKYHQFNTTGTFKAGSTSDFGIVTDSLALHLDAGDYNSRGASTWTDLSTNSNNGTVTNATLNNDYYYTFNASNTKITAPSIITGNPNFSVDFWFYVTTTGTPIMLGTASSNSALLTYADLGAASNFRIGVYGGDYLSLIDGSLASSTWYHIILTHDQTTTRGYVNGVFDNSATRTLSIGSTATYIGAANTTQYFGGRIAQLRIYNKVLTASEVIQNYNATKTNFV